MRKSSIEHGFERGLFASRWLMAPFYAGLVAALFALLVIFARDLIQGLPAIFTFGPGQMTAEAAILFVLTLIDLSLAANLLLIVLFSGYENFVSKIDTGDDEDRPEWMGTVDFSGLKLKLVASIVAISGISLLKTFMTITQSKAPLTAADERELVWLVGIHLVFVISGVLLAAMDWIGARSKGDKAKPKAVGKAA